MVQDRSPLPATAVDDERSFIFTALLWYVMKSFFWGEMHMDAPGSMMSIEMESVMALR